MEALKKLLDKHKQEILADVLNLVSSERQLAEAWKVKYQELYKAQARLDKTITDTSNRLNTANKEIDRMKEEIDALLKNKTDLELQITEKEIK